MLVFSLAKIGTDQDELVQSADLKPHILMVLPYAESRTVYLCLTGTSWWVWPW